LQILKTSCDKVISCAKRPPQIEDIPMQTTTAPLTALPRALLAAGYKTPKYRSLYEAALIARFPAEQAKSGRWVFCVNDVPQIAASLGLSHAANAA
jgi:hypothetical protein